LAFQSGFIEHFVHFINLYHTAVSDEELVLPSLPGLVSGVLKGICQQMALPENALPMPLGVAPRISLSKLSQGACWT
jgi:hypothetical protein